MCVVVSGGGLLKVRRSVVLAAAGPVPSYCLDIMVRARWWTSPASRGFCFCFSCSSTAALGCSLVELVAARECVKARARTFGGEGLFRLFHRFQCTKIAEA